MASSSPHLPLENIHKCLGTTAHDESAAPNAQGSLDSAKRSAAKLKSGQINMGQRKIQVPQRGRGRGHIFCKHGAHLSKKPKSEKIEGSCEKADFKQRPLPKHYKVLVQLSTADCQTWILVHMVSPTCVQVCVCFSFYWYLKLCLDFMAQTHQTTGWWWE